MLLYPFLPRKELDSNPVVLGRAQEFAFLTSSKMRLMAALGCNNR